MDVLETVFNKNNANQIKFTVSNKKALWDIHNRPMAIKQTPSKEKQTT